MIAIAIAAPKSVSPTWQRFRDAFRRHPTAIVGGVVLVVMVLVAIFAPWLGTIDPQAVSPIRRLKQPSAEFFSNNGPRRDISAIVRRCARAM